jgi:hypothetical protein
MWRVDNQTPFSAERSWARDRNGVEVWVVAVKCTYDILPDGSTLVSDAQPPPVLIPEYLGEPGKSSLRFEGDLVLTKTTTDVVVLGHAYAPGGRPVSRMDVGFRVGPVQKVLRVSGDRRWGLTGSSAPTPFVTMPLVYERAFGGVDRNSDQPDRDFYWPNPVGTGFALSSERLFDTVLPNIEYPDQLISGWQDRPPAAGFGPISSHWQTRVALAGTYDDNWMKARQPLLPHDFDERFFQCVPQDQQAPTFLRGGEDVIVRGMTPSGDLRLLLPKVFLGLETRFYDGTRELHQDRRLHTVILEPDFPRVSLVWHSALPCHFKVQKLERTIVTTRTPLDADAGFERGRRSESV